MKVIKITKENQGMIMSRYAIHPDDAEELAPIGYILVADFGSEEHPELVETIPQVLTQVEEFDARFTVGQPLRNDFFEAVKK